MMKCVRTCHVSILLSAIFIYGNCMDRSQWGRAAVIIAGLFKQFYYAVRTKDKKRYSRSALKGIRAGIQSHIKGKPYFHMFNISRDSDFIKANQVYSGYLTKPKKDGLDETTHKKQIRPGDVQQLYSHVFTDTPQGLLYRTFYEVVHHFGRRGCKGLIT